MKSIQINSRKYKMISTWDELSSKKFLKLAHLKCCYPNPTDYSDILTMELMAFSILTNVPLSIHDRIQSEVWPDLLKEVRWILLLPKFRDNPLPKIRKVNPLGLKTIEFPNGKESFVGAFEMHVEKSNT